MSGVYGKVTPEVVAELRQKIGDRNVVYEDRDALENYACDTAGVIFAHNPDAVVKPENAEQVSAVMETASRYRVPVTPRGAGSGLAGAAIPVKGGIVLSIEKMNRILEIDPVNRVAVVEPGVVTNDLCKAAAEKGFLYAGYPMSTETSFIGGNVGTNAGGGKVIRYGSTRRHVLGLEVVLPSGAVVQLGGKFRKDTWGYSLLQLMVGSEGTLGVITKVIVNLEPLPGRTVNLLAAYPDLDTMVSTVAKVVQSGTRVISCEFFDRFATKVTTDYVGTPLPYQDRTEAYLLIQIEGNNDDEIEAAYEKVGKICEAQGAFEVFVAESRIDSQMIWNVRQNLAEGMRAYDPYCSLSGDVVVPLSAVPSMIKTINRLAEKWRVPVGNCGHIADGNIHPLAAKPDGMPPEEWGEYAEQFFHEMIEEAVKLGGVGSGEHGVGFLKLPTLLSTKTPEERRIHRAIKLAFDPLEIMNPGKLVQGE
ncbi:MAG: FAD-binding oxidoreductase [Synergistaceae bacterium]|jgi:glycolate oxidase|nr:FAD-binding oxidoreductase [Synergistaceae bacterium]